MRILKKINPPLIIALFFLACKPQGPVTPREAFLNLRAAFKNSDAGMLSDLLSRDSVKKINVMRGHFSRLTDAQRAALAEAYGIGHEKLHKLGFTGMVRIILSIENRKPGLSAGINRDIAGIDRKGDRATVTVDNGMYYSFVREGPYWKFDISFE